MGVLYRLTFPDGKSYIGVTSQPLAVRLRQHRRKQSVGQIVGRAIHEFGFRNVKVETLAVAEGRPYLALLERRAVEAFGTLAPDGYNGIPGGHYSAGISYMSEEQKALRRGRKASAETRAKMSAAHKGRKQPAGYSEKLSERSRGNKYARGRWLTAVGVTFLRGKWRASLMKDGKRQILGVFVDRADALAARAAAVKEALAACPL